MNLDETAIMYRTVYLVRFQPLSVGIYGVTHSVGLSVWSLLLDLRLFNLFLFESLERVVWPQSTLLQLVLYGLYRLL